MLIYDALRESFWRGVGIGVMVALAPALLGAPFATTVPAGVGCWFGWVFYDVLAYWWRRSGRSS